MILSRRNYYRRPKSVSGAGQEGKNRVPLCVCLVTTAVKMSGQPIIVKLELDTQAPSSFPVVLKKIMEMPPPNILDGDDGESRKSDAYRKAKQWRLKEAQAGKKMQ